MTNWRRVHSDTRPAELDTTSSQAVVYERRNIVEEEIVDPITEKTITQWTYEERTYTKEEYQNLTSPTTQLVMQSISELELGIAELSYSV